MGCAPPPGAIHVAATPIRIHSICVSPMTARSYGVTLSEAKGLALRHRDASPSLRSRLRLILPPSQHLTGLGFYIPLFLVYSHSYVLSFSYPPQFNAYHPPY